jgi:peptide/nickel transport system ATP-binding protein
MGLTYMFITHNLSVVKHISNEIAVMYLGQCVERASSDELFANPLHPYTNALLKAILVPNLKYRFNIKETIMGEITSPIDPKPGCRFASRCRDVCDKCRDHAMILLDQGNNHFVSCVKFE